MQTLRTNRAVFTRCAQTLSVLTLVAYIAPAIAQQTASQYQELGQLMRAPRAIAALGNDLLGDRVNLYSGSLEFVQTDVTLPGNSALPVSMGRRLTAGVQAPEGTHFGRWDMEIPHLHGIFASIGWQTGLGTDSTLRCSQFGAPPDAQGSYVNNPALFKPGEFWHGNFIYIPGLGDQEMLRRTSGNTQAPNGASSNYPVVTRDNWQFSCLPAMAYGGGGEAFIALAPDGTTYRFDWLVSRAAPRLTKTNGAPDPFASATEAVVRADAATVTRLPPPTSDSVPADMNMLNRSEVWILPTVITDRYGNTVTYTYDATNRWQLKTIVGTDVAGSSRTLTLTYVAPGSSSNLVSSVTDGTRTWTYSYDNTTIRPLLVSVTLPDGTSSPCANIT